MKVGMYMVPARVAFLDLGFRLKGEGGMLPAATRRRCLPPAAACVQTHALPRSCNSVRCNSVFMVLNMFCTMTPSHGPTPAELCSLAQTFAGKGRSGDVPDRDPDHCPEVSLKRAG